MHSLLVGQAGGGTLIEGPGWTHALSALALVLLLIVGLAVVARRLPGIARGRRGRGTLEIRETLPLGQRRFLLLLRMGERLAVVGVSGDRIALLKELPPAEEGGFPAALAAAAPEEAS